MSCSSRDLRPESGGPKQHPAWSVVVPVSVMGRVPMAVVHVVGVIAVWHRDVATVRPVLVFMALVSRVILADLAFVHVVAVDAVDVAVVHEVRVVAMRNGDVATVLAMGVLVISMREVLNRTGHAGRSSPCLCGAGRRTALSFPGSAVREPQHHEKVGKARTAAKRLPSVDHNSRHTVLSTATDQALLTAPANRGSVAIVRR